MWYLFLQQFVGKLNNTNKVNNNSSEDSNGKDGGKDKPTGGKAIPWAHLDIAGPVWDSGKRQATGYGVKLLTNYLLNISKGK